MRRTIKRQSIIVGRLQSEASRNMSVLSLAVKEALNECLNKAK